MDRLEKIAQRLVGPVVCDVGTDHGRIPLLALHREDITKVIATDISEKSLEKCRIAIQDHPRKDAVELVVTDGLVGIDTTELSTIVITGMGGHTIMGILEGAVQEGKPLSHLILSPQKGEEEVRRYLHEHGFTIEEDTWIFDAGKFYTLMRAVPGKQVYEEAIYYRYGKQAVEERNPVLLMWLAKQIQMKEEILATKRMQYEQRLELMRDIKKRKEEYNAILA